MGVVAIDLDRDLLAELLPAGAAVVALGAALIMMHHHALRSRPAMASSRTRDRDHDAAGTVPGDHGTVPDRRTAATRSSLACARTGDGPAAHAGRLHLDH